MLHAATTLLAIAAAATTPQVHAHRGGTFVDGRATYAESTLPAFRASARARDVLEFDIQMTKDGVPIVLHDDTLDRTTPCTGKVADLTAAEIRSSCPTDVIGSPGSVLGARATSRRDRIPTVAEVLALAARTRARVNAELKQFDPTGASAAALARAIRASNVALSRVIVQSFFPPNLEAAHRELPGVTTSMLTLAAGNAVSIDLARSTRSAWVSPEWPVDAAYVKAAHAAGLKVVPFTLDRSAEVRAARAAGVDAIITDNPSMARRVLRRR
jgi:glycerophosphoryl diester phosphodiesterase